MSISITQRLLQLPVVLLLLWIGTSCCDAFVPPTIYRTAAASAAAADIQRYFALSNVGGSQQDVVSDDPTINERRLFTATTWMAPSTSSSTEAVSVSTTTTYNTDDDDIMVDLSLQPLLRPPTITTTRPQLRVDATTTPDTTTTYQNDDDDDQRTVLLLLWSIAAISALDRVAMSVALVPMSLSQNDGGASSVHAIIITDTTKGLISSYFSVGYGLAIIPAGLLVSCVSPKTLMTVGILTWSVATMATPVAADWMMTTTMFASTTTALVPILLVRSLVGMGEAILIPTVHRLLSVWTTRQQKSSALAFIFSGFHAGTIGAYLLSPYIMDVWSINSQNDWRLLFYVYGTLGVLILIPWLAFAKDEPTTNKSGASATTTRTSWDEALQSYRNAPWKGFIGSKGVWGMLLAHSAKNWGLYTSLSWTPTFYAEQYNIGVRDSAWLSVMPSVAGALGGFIAGSLADTTLHQMSGSMINDVTTTRIRKLFQTVGLLGPAIALSALATHLPEEAWLAQLYLMVAVGLQSFNAGGFEAGTQDKAGPRWIGMLYSVTSLPSVIVGTFGVYATGVVLDLSHQDWSIVWYMNAAVNVLGALAFIGLYDSKREFD